MFAQIDSKLLAVLTNHEIDDNGKSTGLWFSELTHFYNVFEDTKYSIDFVSPKGGNVPIDPASLSDLDEVSKKYYNDLKFMGRINNTLSASDIKFEDYAVIYFAGGHGAMWDFTENISLQELTTQIYEKFSSRKL